MKKIILCAGICLGTGCFCLGRLRRHLCAACTGTSGSCQGCCHDTCGYFLEFSHSKSLLPYVLVYSCSYKSILSSANGK